MADRVLVIGKMLLILAKRLPLLCASVLQTASPLEINVKIGRRSRSKGVGLHHEW